MMPLQGPALLLPLQLPPLIAPAASATAAASGTTIIITAFETGQNYNGTKAEADSMVVQLLDSPQ